MPESIFRIGSEGELETVEETFVADEDRLQKLLARYPDVLAGNQISRAAPRRWVLVAREMSVPDAAEAAGRWSLDHLFLDQDGIPTLVEVKRSVDTRIRREVVGQMLDYAANAAVYWKTTDIRTIFEQRYLQQGIGPEEALSGQLDIDPDGIDEYWTTVDTNLRAGRLRLIFLADEIPVELLRIIEFLDAQMRHAEVFGVELRQFGEEAGAVLVPRIVGRTAQSERTKARGPRATRQWDEASFFEELAKDRDPAEVAVARRLFEWGRDHYPEIFWGEGLRNGSCYPRFGPTKWTDSPTIWTSSLFGLRTRGVVKIMFDALEAQPPFDEEQRRFELLRRLNAFLPEPIPEDDLPRQPNINLADLTEPGCIDELLTVFEWVFEQIKE
jgi:hypothetical protein